MWRTQASANLFTGSFIADFAVVGSEISLVMSEAVFGGGENLFAEYRGNVNNVARQQLADVDSSWSVLYVPNSSKLVVGRRLTSYGDDFKITRPSAATVVFNPDLAGRLLGDGSGIMLRTRPSAYLQPQTAECIHTNVVGEVVPPGEPAALVKRGERDDPEYFLDVACEPANQGGAYLFSFYGSNKTTGSVSEFRVELLSARTPDQAAKGETSAIKAVASVPVTPGEGPSAVLVFESDASRRVIGIERKRPDGTIVWSTYLFDKTTQALTPVVLEEPLPLDAAGQRPQPINSRLGAVDAEGNIFALSNDGKGTQLLKFTPAGRQTLASEFLAPGAAVDALRVVQGKLFVAVRAVSPELKSIGIFELGQ